MLDVFIRDMPPVARLDPAIVDFGTREVGTGPVPGAAVLVNGGWGPLSVSGVTIAGSAKGDYAVVANGCAKALLHRSEACTITVVFTPAKAGARTATLQVAGGFAGSPRTARLTGRGSLAVPTVTPSPTACRAAGAGR